VVFSFEGYKTKWDHKYLKIFLAEDQIKLC
jgi:hypothetical protein